MHMYIQTKKSNLRLAQLNFSHHFLPFQLNKYSNYNQLRLNYVTGTAVQKFRLSTLSLLSHLMDLCFSFMEADWLAPFWAVTGSSPMSWASWNSLLLMKLRPRVAVTFVITDVLSYINITVGTCYSCKRGKTVTS